jgi:hypothetical protein
MSLPQILIAGELLNEGESIAVQEAIREKFVELNRYITLQYPDGKWVTEELSPAIVQMYLDLARQLKRIDPLFPFKEDIRWNDKGEPLMAFDPFANGRKRVIRAET